MQAPWSKINKGNISYIVTNLKVFSSHIKRCAFTNYTIRPLHLQLNYLLLKEFLLGLLYSQFPTVPKNPCTPLFIMSFAAREGLRLKMVVIVIVIVI